MNKRRNDIIETVDLFLQKLSELEGAWLLGMANDHGSNGQAAKEILEREGFIFYHNPGSRTSICNLTEKGLAVLENGGYRKYLDEKIKQAERKDRADELQNKLAESNLESNQIQISAARYNKIFGIINILLGALNIGLLIWQLLRKN